MRLREWQDSNGQKVNTTSPMASNTSSGSFKKRLEKLLTYITKHRDPKINKIISDKLTADSLEFTEYYVDDSTRSYEIYIGPATEAWRLKIYFNDDLNTPVNDLAGTGWVELLKALRYYIVVPVVSTPEYKNLLTESSSSIADDFKLYENLWD